MERSTNSAAETPEQKAEATVVMPQVEREHLELQANQQKFATAVESGASRVEVLARLTLLMDVCQTHFDSEERLMQSHNYRELQPHSEEHRKLIQQMARVCDDVRSGIITPCGVLATFVRRWFEEHVAGLDTHFMNFLSQQHFQDEEVVPYVADAMKAGEGI